MQIFEDLKQSTHSFAKPHIHPLMIDEKTRVVKRRYPQFFNGVHSSRVVEVLHICERFFLDEGGGWQAIYAEAVPPTKRRRAYSFVKIRKPKWPNLTPEKKQELFYKPLEALQVTLHRGYDSLQIKIWCCK